MKKHSLDSLEIAKILEVLEVSDKVAIIKDRFREDLRLLR